ncbi:MAG: hypothetical protein BWK73_39055 [Thiothrix lacustris]|uniref:Uncharacterized protein n=1 Tax=Thiothrix lacustris TaxID=525917 RepID=A0A1Y1QEN2_9GAMM|nr:MAG: hypothetical protein BWK73_39055 [Thiothrix lacustris]
MEQRQSKTAQAAENGRGIDGTVEYVIGILKDIDAGKEVYTDFISSQDITDFCELIGFKDTWAGITDSDIATSKDFGIAVVDAKEASIILNILKREIDKGSFVPKSGGDFNTHVLDDFLPKPQGLGHLWEYQFGLRVELEHGRTRGTNVTNNHPLLTGMIVMAHLTEDTLYYARLWVMEVEGELFNARLKGEDISDFQQELEIARRYLVKRETEKYSTLIPA